MASGVRTKIAAILAHPMLPAVALFLALWPVWIWYVERMTVPWDEPWGIVALITAALFLALRKPAGPVRPRHLIVPALLTTLYAAAFPFLEPLPRAAIGISAFGYLLAACRLGTPAHVGSWALFLLSLPIIPSLQFYCGYPLRLLTAMLAAPLLQLDGFPVFADGTCLNWNGTLVWVDAPCSGVRMLWVGLYLAATLACFGRLGNLRTIAALLAALVLVVLGNALRAAALFFIEAGVVELPAWAHDAVGLVVFLIIAVAIVWCARWLQRTQSCAARSSFWSSAALRRSLP